MKAKHQGQLVWICDTMGPWIFILNAHSCTTLLLCLHQCSFIPSPHHSLYSYLCHPVLMIEYLKLQEDPCYSVKVPDDPFGLCGGKNPRMLHRNEITVYCIIEIIVKNHQKHWGPSQCIITCWKRFIGPWILLYSCRDHMIRPATGGRSRSIGGSSFCFM